MVVFSELTGPVVQWTEQETSKLLIEVRFLAGPPLWKNSTYVGFFHSSGEFGRGIESG